MLNFKHSRTLGIFGAGGHAKVVTDTVTRQAKYQMLNYYDDDEKRHGERFYRNVLIRGGLPQLLNDLSSGRLDVAFCAIGDNETRVRVGKQILNLGYELATVVDPTAIISPTVRIQCGTLIVAGAIINSDTDVGAHVIVNTGASIDHDCIIENGVHIGPQATLCGGVQIGFTTLIGAGATIPPTISCPAQSILGAGSTLTTTPTQRGTFVGTPAVLTPKVNEKI